MLEKRICPWDFGKNDVNLRSDCFKRHLSSKTSEQLKSYVLVLWFNSSSYNLVNHHQEDVNGNYKWRSN